MRKLLQVLALTLAVVLGPRIALAEALSAGAGSADAVTSGPASLKKADCDPVSREQPDKTPSRPQQRKTTWGFARRWRLTTRRCVGGFEAIRGLAGVASARCGGEDGTETQSQRGLALSGGGCGRVAPTWPQPSKILTPAMRQ